MFLCVLCVLCVWCLCFMILSISILFVLCCVFVSVCDYVLILMCLFCCYGCVLLLLIMMCFVCFGDVIVRYWLFIVWSIRLYSVLFMWLFRVSLCCVFVCFAYYCCVVGVVFDVCFLCFVCDLLLVMLLCPCARCFLFGNVCVYMFYMLNFHIVVSMCMFVLKNMYRVCACVWFCA